MIDSKSTTGIIRSIYPGIFVRMLMLLPINDIQEYWILIIFQKLLDPKFFKDCIPTSIWLIPILMMAWNEENLFFLKKDDEVKQDKQQRQQRSGNLMKKKLHVDYHFL